MLGGGGEPNSRLHNVRVLRFAKHYERDGFVCTLLGGGVAAQSEWIVRVCDVLCEVLCNFQFFVLVSKTLRDSININGTCTRVVLQKNGYMYRYHT